MPDGLRPAAASGLFRLAAGAVALLVAAAVAVSLLVFRDIDAVVTGEVAMSLEGEAASYRAFAGERGAGALAEIVERRSRLVPGGVQILTDASGRRIAGNLAEIPAAFEKSPHGAAFVYRTGEAVGAARRAVGLLQRLPDGGALILGRDIEDQIAAVTRIRMTIFIGFAALALAGLAAGYAASRHVMQRVGAVAATARAIMAGDMRRRIAVSGSGDEIDELSANLNRMLDRIEQLMAGLREVSDNIAHDLKTPLNRLRNGAEAALRDARGVDSLRDGLERAIVEADELIKVFNAMLLIARLEAGALEGTTEAIDVSDLVRNVAELYEPVAEEAGLRLEVAAEEGQVVVANRHLVGQAVANLIDNAIKYSVAPAGKGGSRRPATRVDVNVGGAGGDWVAISIADDGPGIPAADRERVLRRFVRLEQSRSLPGTGLGLSLVAAVARLHHGALSLEDNEPGLRVVLRLPRRASASPAGSAARAA